MTRRCVTFLGTAAALLAPAPALAAWQAEPIPDTAGAAPPGSFAFDREGTGAIVFSVFTPRRVTGVAVRAPAGGWAREGNIAGLGASSAARVHLYGKTRALLIARRSPGTLVWSLGRTSGGFGRLRTLARNADGPASAANAAGDALVAYTPRRATGVRVSERRAGRRFARPRVLGPKGSLDPAVAVNARGDRVVAWLRGNRLEARVRPAGGRWSATRTVMRLTRTENVSLRALVTDDRRIALAWHTVRVSENRPARVAAGAAIRRINGAWKSALLEQSRLDTEAYLGEALAIPLVTASGEVLVAWTGRWRSATGVRIAQLRNTGSVHGPTLVSGEDQVATLDDAAAGPQVAVTYAAHAGNDARTFAALGSGIDAFAPPEPLTPDGEIGLVGSRVAFTPSGTPVVVRPLVSGGRGALAAAVRTG
jgi:hypothetical protein